MDLQIGRNIDLPVPESGTSGCAFLVRHTISVVVSILIFKLSFNIIVSPWQRNGVVEETPQLICLGSRCYRRHPVCFALDCTISKCSLVMEERKGISLCMGGWPSFSV